MKMRILGAACFFFGAVVGTLTSKLDTTQAIFVTTYACSAIIAIIYAAQEETNKGAVK